MAQRPAQQPAGIAAGTARMAPEQLGPSLSGQRSEAQKVSYLDAGQRPIHVRGHSAIVAPMLQVRFATMPKRPTCGRSVRPCKLPRESAERWHDG